MPQKFDFVLNKLESANADLEYLRRGLELLAKDYLINTSHVDRPLEARRLLVAGSTESYIEIMPRDAEVQINSVTPLRADSKAHLQRSTPKVLSILIDNSLFEIKYQRGMPGEIV